MPTTSLLRRRVFQLVGSIVVLDVIAIGAYQLAHVGATSARTQLIFSGTWLILTVLLVLLGLNRVRDARLRGRARQ